jgi:hypothetical protein
MPWDWYVAPLAALLGLGSAVGQPLTHAARRRLSSTLWPHVWEAGLGWCTGPLHFEVHHQVLCHLAVGSRGGVHRVATPQVGELFGLTVTDAAR